MKMEKKMVAKFAGKCRVCGGRIEVRSNILWSREKGAAHAVCPASAPAPAAPSARSAAIEAIHAAAHASAMKWGAEGYDPEFEEVEFERLYAAKFEPNALVSRMAAEESARHEAVVRERRAW